MCSLKLWFTVTRLKLVVSFRPFFWVYHVRSWNQRMTAKKTRQVLLHLEHSKNFYVPMYFVGFLNEKQAAHWKSLRLKLPFRSFFSAWSSNNHNGDGSINGTTKRLHIHVRFNFYCILFRCCTQNNVNLMFKLKVLWRTQSLSHDIQIKNHSFNYNSWLEQTYNLIGKTQILEKKMPKV